MPLRNLAKFSETPTSRGEVERSAEDALVVDSPVRQDPCPERHGLMVTVYACDAVEPSVSVAVNEKVKEPLAVGVPDSTAVVDTLVTVPLLLLLA